MGKFGDRLRKERKARGVTLDAMATSTKISTRMLAALEEEKFNILPGGIFNRGFVRAYAKFLGLDEDEAVADYLQAAGHAETEPAEGVDPKLEKTLANWRRPESEELSDRGSSWTAIAVVVLIAVSVFTGYTVVSKRRAERRAHEATTQKAAILAAGDGLDAASKPTDLPPTSSAATATTSSSAPVTATTGDISQVTQIASTSTAQAVPSRAVGQVEANKEDPKSVDSGSVSSVELMLRARKDSWISVTADGKLVLQDLLRAPAERSVRAKDKVVVILGNAGGVDVSYNGKPLPAFGGDQEVRTVTFRPNGYQ